jgi:hypothetical protein
MAMVEESRGRIQIIKDVEKARIEASVDWLKILESLREHLVALAGSRIASGYVSIVRELLSRVGQDDAADRKRLRNLEHLLAEDRLIATDITQTEFGTSPMLPEQTGSAEEEAEASQTA